MCYHEVVNGNGETTIRHYRDYDPAPILRVLPEEKLSSPDEALTAMRALGRVLPDSDFSHLIPFTHIYTELTFRVIDAIQKGRFNDPVSATRAIPDFYQRFATPARSFLLGDNQGAGAWAPGMHPRMQRAKPVIQFARDMITHIQVDLKHTVAEVGALDSYHGDFTNIVGECIDDTARELAGTYLPYAAPVQSRILDTMLGRIADWREDAWQDGEQLAPFVGDPEMYKYAVAGLANTGPSTGFIYRYPGNWALRALDIVAPGPPVSTEPIEFERAA